MSPQTRPAIRKFAVLIVIGLLAGWAYVWSQTGGTPPPQVPGDEPNPHLAGEFCGYGSPACGPDEHYSNILPGDYVGPDSCAKCHEKQHELWSAHPHRFMNQLPSPASIKGDFNNHVWTIRPGYTVAFTTEDGNYWMTIEQPGKSRTRYKVTRTIGSRFIQTYIGLQTEGPEPPDQRYTTEHKLPFIYWFRLNRWLPVDYLDAGDAYPEEFQEGRAIHSYIRGQFTKTAPGAEEYYKDGTPIVPGVDIKSQLVEYTTCVHCHNTYPNAYRLFRPSLRGFPDTVVRFDPKPLTAPLADKLPAEPTAKSFAYLPSKVDPNKDLVTHGVSCESCHFGGREHAEQKKAVSFFPTNPHVLMTALKEDKPFTGKRDNTATIQGICAQCHSSGGAASYPNNSRIRNSAEAIELLLGSCATQISCVSCHDPHTAGVPSGGPTLAKHVNACISCHPKYASEEQAALHSRHSATSGVNCLDCHMPRITQGVDEIVRSHRIAPPVELSMVSSGSPNACNVCHLDKTVEWTLDELKRGWGKEFHPPPDSISPDYLNTPAGDLWLYSREPIIRMVATDAYSRSPLWKSKLPEVLNSLNDDQPPNRVFAIFATERMLGRRMTTEDIDICAGPGKRLQQIEQLQRVLEKKKK